MTGLSNPDGTTPSQREIDGGRGGATFRRRRLLGAIGTLGVAAVAGCSGDGGDDARSNADVVAGPEGRLVFEPETVTVAPGETVTWSFDSPGHNVSGRPGDSDLVALPAGAEPYATYGPDQSPLRLVPSGERFEHQFTVPGTYVYVCVPHERAGMVGRVNVEA